MKPIEHHLRAGTFRTDRHGPRPSNVVAMPSHGVVGWVPVAEDFAMMAPVGRTFVERMLGTYDFSLIEGRLLLEAGHAAGRLAENRAISRTGDLTVQEIATLERTEISWQKQFAALLAQLKVQT